MMPPSGLPVRCRNTSYMICTAGDTERHSKRHNKCQGNIEQGVLGVAIVMALICSTTQAGKA
jgi:hypothetical protein